MKSHIPSGVPFLTELPLAQYLASGYQMYRRCLYSQASVASFLNAAETHLHRLLLFYNPTLPAAQRVSATWPLMRPADLVIVVLTYLVFVACVLIVHGLSSRVHTPHHKQEQQESATHEAGKRIHHEVTRQERCGELLNQMRQEQKMKEGRSKHPLFEKMGVTLVVQTIYNVLQVCICSYVVHQTIVVFAREGYTVAFNRFDPSRTSMAEIVWLFYLKNVNIFLPVRFAAIACLLGTKVFDLADTLLIVWRRKWNQFSFLHIYHHSSVICMMWINASVGYDGDIYFAVLANAGIHVVMYTYYFMASLSLSLASKMKKFVTQVQMTQFVLMLFQGIYHTCFYHSCEYPLRIAAGYMLYIISMYILFAQFSKRTYGTHTHGTSSKICEAGSSKIALLKYHWDKLGAAAHVVQQYIGVSMISTCKNRRARCKGTLHCSPSAASVFSAAHLRVSGPTSAAVVARCAAAASAASSSPPASAASGHPAAVASSAFAKHTAMC